MRKTVCFLIVLVCLLSAAVTSSADSADLPDSLLAIKDDAFFQNTSITEVHIPSGAKTIGARAFAKSGLQKIYLPVSVDSIDTTAFDGLTDDFIIVTPINSYSHQYAVNHHYRADIKESFTIESDIGDSFVVDAVVDSGQNMDIRCSVASDYTGSDSTKFAIIYGVSGNSKYRSDISLEELRRGYTCSFSKEEVQQHDIPPVIALHIDIKDRYTIASDIGDSFVAGSIIDFGSTIGVLCRIANDYSAANNTSFVLCYGVDGNEIARDGISLQDMKKGYYCSFFKDVINQHNIPSVLTLYTNIKDSYTVTADIGSSFMVSYIIDTGKNIIMRSSVSSDYSADDNTMFSLHYGIDGNCMNQNEIPLQVLKRGYICMFSKNVIDQYQIPRVISLQMQ